MANTLDIGLRLSLNQAGLANARTGLQQVGKQLQQLRREVIGFAGAFVSLQGIQVLGQLADEYKNLSARLKNTTDSAKEYVAAQQEVYAIAQRTQTPLGDLVASYARVDAAVRTFGGSQRLSFETTERLVQASKVYATSNEASKEVLAQLTGAFADGIVKSNEFSQIIKNAPGLLQAMASGLGISTGELRTMAAEGKLSAQVMTRALAGAAEEISKKAAEIPATIGDAVVVMRNSFVKALGELDAKLGASSGVAETFNAVAANMKVILDGLILAVTVLGAVLLRNLVLSLSAATAGLIANAIAARAAASAAAEMGIVIKGNITLLGLLNGALNVFVALVAGLAIGTWLRENFKIARDAGYALMGGLMEVWERIRAGFLAIGPVLVLAWQGTMDKLAEIAAKFYDGVAAIFDRLPGAFASSMAQSMRDAAARLRGSIGEGAGDVAGAELDRIMAEAEANIEAIRDGMSDLIAAPMESAAPASDVGRIRTGGGGGEAPDAKEVAKRMKDELERAQTELEQGLRRRQFTEQQYYDARRDLIQIAYDKDLVAQREAMDKLDSEMAEGFERRAELIASRLARTEERIARDRDLGRIGTGEAKERTGAERAKAQAEIAELVKAAEPLRGILGDDTVNRLKDIQHELGELKTPLQELGDELKSNLQDPLADAFQSIIKGTKSAKDAFQDFGRAVIDIIIRIIAQKLAAQVVGGIFTFAEGGPVGKADGGYISGPGGPTDDKIPAMLSNGEYVIKAKSVRRWGKNFLDWLNDPTSSVRPDAGMGYASGGVVRGAKMSRTTQLVINMPIDARGTDAATVSRLTAYTDKAMAQLRQTMFEAMRRDYAPV